MDGTHLRNAAFLACLTLVLGTSSARANLAISPTIIRPRAFPGGIKQLTVGLSNRGHTVLHCTAEVYAMKVTGGGMPVAVDKAPRSCRDWIKITPEKFKLPAKTGRRVIVRINVPEKAAGGYYALISFLGKPEGADKEEGKKKGVRSTVRLSYRTMAAVLLTVPGPQLKAVIDSARPVIETDQKGGKYTVKVPVRNRGNIHGRLSGRIEVRSQAGQMVDRFELEAGRGFILPGQERVFKSTGEVKLPDGFYVARVTLRMEKFRRPMQKDFAFHVRDGEPSFAQISDELREKIRKQSAGFIVSPAARQIVIPPGGRRAQTAKLTNLTKEPITVLAKVCEWRRTAGGADHVLTDEPGHGRSGRELVTLRTEEVSIRGRGTRRVPVTVSFPRDGAGERYAAVLFDRKDIQLDAAPAVRARRSVLLRIAGQRTGKPDAKVETFTAERQPNGAVKLAATVANVGNRSITPEVRFSVRTADGAQVGRVQPSSGGGFILAGAKGRIGGTWDKILNPGEYAAEATIRYAGDRPAITGRAKFRVPERGETDTKPADAATNSAADTNKTEDQQ